MRGNSLSVGKELPPLHKGFMLWHCDAEPDSTIQPFAKRLVKEAGMPGAFTNPVAQSIQVN